MTLLNEITIRERWHSKGFQPDIGLHLFQSIDSTNQYLKTLPKQHPIEICCAQMQTQGRGRLNRPWYSPDADNIYCSGRWYFPQDIASLSSLSLVVSMAIMRCLLQWHISTDIAIKWPNDLLWQHKKLCGILIESYQDPCGALAVIIGIGLNVNIKPDDLAWKNALTRPWCSLYEIVGHPIDRDRLLADLIIQLDQDIHQFIRSGFTPFYPIWQRWDYLQGKQITLTQPTGQLAGIAQGITDKGQLIIIDAAQQTHFVSSGEASITEF
jgi:BirA family biotin operon repressor/biotin-[acetyl-CoA-carboxylase] ligase